MNKCLICDEFINNKITFSSLFTTKSNLICLSCKEKFEKVSDGCIRCGKKTIKEICPDCLYWDNYELTKSFKITNYSLYYYNHFARSIVKQIKFNGDLQLLKIFVFDMKKLFLQLFPRNMYCLVVVPIHQDRLLERGFNQSLQIAKLLPYKIFDIFEKINNKKQSKKKRSERIVFDNTYKIKEKIDFSNKKVIIVDDIYTTGATIYQIGKLLYELNAKEVVSFTLFRS